MQQKAITNSLVDERGLLLIVFHVLTRVISIIGILDLYLLVSYPGYYSTGLIPKLVRAHGYYYGALLLPALVLTVYCVWYYREGFHEWREREAFDESREHMRFLIDGFAALGYSIFFGLLYVYSATFF